MTVRADRAAAGRLMKRAAAASVAVAATLIIAKVGAWLATDSVAMLSSLLDSLLDAAASAINLLAVRHALTPADEEHRFGHGKAEPLAGLAQSAFICGSALILLMEALHRLGTPQPVQRPEIGIAVALFSIALSAGLVFYQRRVVARTGSVAIAADSLHYGSDALLNGAVVAALVVGMFVDAPLVDPWIVEGEDGPGLEPTVSGVVPFAYPHGATAGDDGVVWLLDNGRGVDSEVVGLVDDDGVIEEIARVSLGRACPESGGVWPVGDGSFVATCAREKQALRVLPGGDGPVWALTSGCVAPEPSPATPDAIPRFVPGDPLAPHEAGDRARVHTGAAPRVRGDRTHVE